MKKPRRRATRTKQPAVQLSDLAVGETEQIKGGGTTEPTQGEEPVHRGDLQALNTEIATASALVTRPIG